MTIAKHAIPLETKNQASGDPLGALKVFLTSWPTRHHWRRYWLGGIVSVAGVWALCLAYLVFMPTRYTSKWTLILPGAGAGVSVSLESIGQTSSVSASPFSSPALSPKVIYKEIAGSEQVVGAAAKKLGMTLSEFGLPQIKLIDETALMLFEISDRRADIAQKKALALTDALLAQLDALRHDEIEQRAASVRDTPKSYQENVSAAGRRIYDAQQKSGLLSVEQFNGYAASLEEARRKLTEARAEAARLETEEHALVERLGLDAPGAAAALLLAADPLFTKALGDYADADASLAAQSKLLGARNPLMARDRFKRDGALKTLRQIARKYHVNESRDLPRLIIVLNSKAREELVKNLVLGETLMRGKRREVESLEAEIRRQEIAINDLTADAAKLDDLKKDHLVAEAVFSSALARLDTNKADLFASYPIVQVLSPPDLPEKKSQPRLLFAIAGGAAGALLSAAAWTLAWLRQLFVRKHRRK